MRRIILLISVLLLSAQSGLAEDVTNVYATQGGGYFKTCGAPPAGQWTLISADNAGYPCMWSSGITPDGLGLCDPDGTGSDTDYWSYIIHGHVTLGSHIIIRGSSNASTDGTASLTVNAPVPINNPAQENVSEQASDILLAQVAAYSTSATPVSISAVPSGWTQVTVSGSTSNSAGTEAEWLFYHVVSSPQQEPSSYTWEFNTNAYAAGGIADYANVNTSSPIVSAKGKFASASNPTSITCPALASYPNDQLLCFMTTFAGIPFGAGYFNWVPSPSTPPTGTTGHLYMPQNWLVDFLVDPPQPATPIDLGFFDRTLLTGDVVSAETAGFQQGVEADNTGIMVELKPAARTVTKVEVRTYIGGGGQGDDPGGCQVQGSMIACTNVALVEDSTYAMPSANSINVPFDVAEFNLPSHYSTFVDLNYQAFYVYVMPTGGPVSCTDEYLDHETN